MNILVQVSWCTHVHIFVVSISWIGFMVHRVCILSTLVANSSFPNFLYQFKITRVAYESAYYSIFLSTLVLFFLFNFNHSSDVICYCCFNFWFWLLMGLSTFSLSIWIIFLMKCLVWTFFLLVWLSFFFKLIYPSSFHILDSSPLSVICVANTF